MFSFNKIVLSFVLCLIFKGTPVYAQDIKKGFNSGVDIYGSHSSLMPYKGYQRDLSSTFSLSFADYPLQAFVRFGGAQYHYLISTDDAAYISDERISAGLGLDFKINEYFKIRYVIENITNKLSATSYTQESYGLIYNQYIENSLFEFNAYLESFVIPRVSRNTADTFVRLQILKSYYLSRSLTTANALYPFLQVKAKYNDNLLFGASGQNASVGIGYKYYGTADEQNDALSFLIEAHSVFYQSKDFNGEWGQVLAAIQLLIK